MQGSYQFQKVYQIKQRYQYDDSNLKEESFSEIAFYKVCVSFGLVHIAITENTY